MLPESILLPAEIRLISVLSRRFARRNWNTWEPQDIYQELCRFWLKRKRPKSKKLSARWKRAMGRCLRRHLEDVQRQSCGDSNGHGIATFVDRIADNESQDIHEGLVLQMLSQGRSKQATAQILGKSQIFFHEKIWPASHFVEPFHQALALN
jgi:hypothetical protein